MARIGGYKPLTPPQPAAPGGTKTGRPVPTGTKPAGVTSDLDVPGVAQEAPVAAWGTMPSQAGRPPGANYGVGLGGVPPGHGQVAPTPVAGTSVMKDMIEKSKTKEVMDMDDTAWKKLLAKFGAFD